MDVLYLICVGIRHDSLFLDRQWLEIQLSLACVSRVGHCFGQLLFFMEAKVDDSLWAKSNLKKPDLPKLNVHAFLFAFYTKVDTKRVLKGCNIRWN